MPHLLLVIACFPLYLVSYFLHSVCSQLGIDERSDIIAAGPSASLMSH